MGLYESSIRYVLVLRSVFDIYEVRERERERLIILDTKHIEKKTEKKKKINSRWIKRNAI